MASPQLEDGYTKIANELLEAMASIRFAGQKFQVVVAVIRLTYGYNKKADEISHGQLSRFTGIPRTKVVKLVQDLVLKKVLSSTNNGTRKPSTIGINKNYSEWVHSPQKGTSPNMGTTSSTIIGTTPSPHMGTHQIKKERKKGVDTPLPPNGDTKHPNCPHNAIIDLYHKHCTALPRIREWTPKRQAVLKSRWNEKAERQSEQWWDAFFNSIAESDFLSGRVNGKNGSFVATIDWILKAENFVKIIEGNYVNRCNGGRKLQGVVSEATERSLQNAKRVLERLQERERDGKPTTIS